MTLNVESVREHFPALASGEIFLDNPGGTQIVRESIDRMVDYLTRMNANHGGAFRTSMESDAMLEQAHSAMGDFLNADPSEVIFGTNMTTLTFGISRTIGRMLRPGDEILVTRLDHDANISPWLALEEERKAKVRWIELNEADLTLDLADAASKLSPRTRLIACGYASNAVGTVNDVRSLVAMAHSVGAWCFVDAVHFAPHGPIDVRALDCDFLVCSVYKFFGPHVGVLYGKKALLEQLPAYKVRPASNLPPGKYETGTLNHEGIAGTLGVTEYLEWLATSATGGRPPLRRRDRLVATMKRNPTVRVGAPDDADSRNCRRSRVSKSGESPTRAISTGASRRSRSRSRTGIRAKLPNGWPKNRSSPGTATTMRWRSWKNWDCSRMAVCSVSDRSTTTRSRKFIGWSRR